MARRHGNSRKKAAPGRVIERVSVHEDSSNNEWLAMKRLYTSAYSALATVIVMLPSVLTIAILLRTDMSFIAKLPILTLLQTLTAGLAVHGFRIAKNVGVLTARAAFFNCLAKAPSNLTLRDSWRLHMLIQDFVRDLPTDSPIPEDLDRFIRILILDGNREFRHIESTVQPRLF